MFSNAIAVILTIIVFLIVWKLMLPTYADNKSTETKVSSELSDAQSEITSIEAAKSDLSSITTTVNQLLVAIPSDKDEPNLISELEAIGAKNSLVLPSIDISSDKSSSADSVQPVLAGSAIAINFTVVGPFANVGTFTDSLEKSIKFMHIKSITMTSADANNVTASYSVETYSRADSSIAGAK